MYVSAAEGTGLDRLLARIDAMIEEDPVSRVHLRVPQKEGKTLAMLEAKARIYSRTYKDGAVELEVEAPESVVRRVTGVGRELDLAPCIGKAQLSRAALGQSAGLPIRERFMDAHRRLVSVCLTVAIFLSGPRCLLATRF